MVYPAPAEGEPEAVAMTAALTAKLKETFFTARMKAIIQVKEDEAKIWNIMWLRMSPASRCKGNPNMRRETAEKIVFSCGNSSGALT